MKCTSYWSNCYFDPFDHFVKRQLGCRAYLRYVDDFALFSDNKRQLWHWKKAIIDRLARYRLSIHESACQVVPTECGAPWLSFVVYRDHRKLKARKARYASRHLAQRYSAWQNGTINFAELDASVNGWVNHVRFADTWGLRKTVFRRLAARRRAANQ